MYQGTPIESRRTPDQKGSPSGKSIAYADPAFATDPALWSHVSPTVLGCQAMMIDPQLEDANPQTLLPPSEHYRIGMDDQANSGSPQTQKAAWEPDAANGCLEKDAKVDLATSTGDNMTSTPQSPRSCPLAAVEPKNLIKRGKTPKPKKSCPIDPYLWEAITAALTKAYNGKHAEPEEEPRSPQVIGLPDAQHASGISLCRIDSREPSPSPAATSAGPPDTQNPSLEASSTSGPEKEAPIDKDRNLQLFLEAIKDAGYVIKKESKSSTVGHTSSQSSGTKKGDRVTCSVCNKFCGRPCELKYASGSYSYLKA